MKDLLLTVILAVLASIGICLWATNYTQKVCKEQVELQIAELQQEQTEAEGFYSYEDLIEYVVVTQREQQNNATLLSLPDNTLLNLFTVCAKKYGVPLTIQEIADEYCTNSDIYSNLPDQEDTTKYAVRDHDVVIQSTPDTVYVQRE
jgi:hypothetical protein